MCPLPARLSAPESELWESFEPRLAADVITYMLERVGNALLEMHYAPTRSSILKLRLFAFEYASSVTSV